jgi:hypothetical protein
MHVGSVGFCDIAAVLQGGGAPKPAIVKAQTMHAVPALKCCPSINSMHRSALVFMLLLMLLVLPCSGERTDARRAAEVQMRPSTAMQVHQSLRHVVQHLHAHENADNRSFLI